MIGFALLIALVAVAGASPPKATSRRDAALARIREALPAGWTIQLTDLPSGVEAIALGPPAREGRAVLVATRIADPALVLDRDLLEQKLGAKILSLDPRGVLGATEVRSEQTSDGTVFTVLHLFGPTVAPFAVTLIVPRSMFNKVYKTLANEAERLADGTRALSENVGAKR